MKLHGHVKFDFTISESIFITIEDGSLQLLSQPNM